jgi:hypothetical protein
MFTICCLWHHAVSSASKKLQTVDMTWYMIWIDDMMSHMIRDVMIYVMIEHEMMYVMMLRNVIRYYIMIWQGIYMIWCYMLWYIWYDVMWYDMICLTPTRMQTLWQQGLPNNNDELYSGLSRNILLWVQGVAWLIAAKKSSLRSARL